VARQPHRASLLAFVDLLEVEHGRHREELVSAINRETGSHAQPAVASERRPAPAVLPQQKQQELSENEWAQRLEQGDPAAIEPLLGSFQWTRHMITKKLCAMRPPAGPSFWVLPVERSISLNSTDAGLALLLFDHDPGLEQYNCARACQVEVTGFDTERLLDGAYWRSRERTRGKLVQS
jgi:hypothetical protein